MGGQGDLEGLGGGLIVGGGQRQTTAIRAAVGGAGHHLDVPEGRLYYEVRGSSPLLLVIGQPMTGAQFGPLADLLASITRW